MKISKEIENQLNKLIDIFGGFLAVDDDGNPVISLPRRNGVSAEVVFCDFELEENLEGHFIQCSNSVGYGIEKLWKIGLVTTAFCSANNYKLAKDIYAIPDAKLDSDFIDEAARDFDNGREKNVIEKVSKLLASNEGGA